MNRNEHEKGVIAFALVAIVGSLYFAHLSVSEAMTPPFLPTDETRAEWREEGLERHTPCASAVVRYFDIDPKSWSHCQCMHDVVKILRANDWEVEYITTDCKTVREFKKRLPPGIFMVSVEKHVLLLEAKRVAVDTYPVVRDKREIIQLYRIHKK